MKNWKNLWVIIIAFSCLQVSCRKDEVEAPAIISDSEVINDDGQVVIESIFEDESKMYFILLDATTAAVTSRESFYGDSNNGYEYRGDVVIPTELTHLGKTYTITTIGERCFADTRLLNSVHIPSTITTIQSEAFYNAVIGAISIPNSVTSIGSKAFSNCNNLSSIIIPESITDLAWGLFADCKTLDSVALPRSLKSIGDEAFKQCDGLTSISLPESLESIGAEAFNRCDGLTSIVFPVSLESIGEGAFAYCSSLITVTIPESVNSLGEEAFSYCENLKEFNYHAISASYHGRVDGLGLLSCCFAIETINIGNQVKKIPFKLFSYSTAVSFNFGNSVTHIEGWAFENSSIKSVTLPESVIEIGNKAFSGCVLLESVTCWAHTPPEIYGTNLFSSSPEVIFVPSQSVELYREAYGWRNYADIIEGI